MNETARSEAIKELENFKAQFTKLLEKFPNIKVGCDFYENVIAYHYNPPADIGYPKVYLPYSHNKPND